jgi:hypothetical protein
MANLELPFGVKVLGQQALDAKYLNDGVPYVSIAEANTILGIGVRSIGLTVNINTIDFYYKDGITNGNLVVKVPDISANNTDELPEGSNNLYSTLARFVERLTLARIVTALGFTPANVDTTYSRTTIDDTFLPVAGGTLLGNTTIGQFCILIGNLTNGIRFRDSTNAYLNFSISDNGDTFTRGTAAIAAGTAASHAVNKSQLDLKVDTTNLSQNLRYETTWGSGSQTFTLPSAYFAVSGVFVQGIALKSTQYTLTSSTQVTIDETLDAGDYVVILYGTNASSNSAPYYTQAQVDSIAANKAPLQVINDTAAASISNVGKTRYYVVGNESFVDMSMQIGASNYAWVNILSNTW